MSHRTHLKPSSLYAIETSWRVHVEPRWGNVAVSEIRKSDVQEWIAELAAQRSATIVIRAHGVLAMILDNAVADRRLLTNPARGIALPRKRPREHIYLTHEQTLALASESGEHQTLVLVLAYTGIRWGEAIGLRVQDLDLTRHRLNIKVNAVEVGGRVKVGTPKTHERRSVPFPNFLTEPLTKRCTDKSPDSLVFPAPDGNHLKRARADAKHTGWFMGAVRRSGVPSLKPHDLRHTAASLAVAAGANVKAVQRMLGHASATMTLDVYADLFDDDLDAVGIAMDHAASQVGVGKLWAGGPETES